MRLANYKVDLAIDMFSMMLESLTDDLLDIQSLWQLQQQQELLQCIHKIKGAEPKLCALVYFSLQLSQYQLQSLFLQTHSLSKNAVSDLHTGQNAVHVSFSFF